MSVPPTPPVPHSRLSRRRFLAALGAVGLAACAEGSGETFNLGNRDRLRVLNWPDYIDVDDDGVASYPGGTLDRLIAETGISQISYDTDYSDNAAGFSLLLESISSGTPYDVAMPTYWRAAELIARDLVEPLPIELIPNHLNIDPTFLTNSWDRGCRFQMPWQAGITGIVYDPEQTQREITSVRDLFDNDLRGRASLVGEMRESVGLTMLAFDDGDPSRPTVAQANSSYDRIAAASENGHFRAPIDSDNLPTLFEERSIAAGLAWSGDVALLQLDRPDLEFVIPAEGAIQWFDTMVIPKGSANVAAAGQFMDFVYDPVNAAGITEWVGYISPVMGTREALIDRGGSSETLASNPLLFPDPATQARLYTWGGLDDGAAEASLDLDFAGLTWA